MLSSDVAKEPRRLRSRERLPTLERPGLKGDELGLWGKGSYKSRAEFELWAGGEAAGGVSEGLACEEGLLWRKEDQVMPWQW